MSNFVLRGIICYTDDPSSFKVYENHYIVCENNVVKGIYEKIPSIYEKYEFYDYKDKLVIPGMIDLHLHAPQYAFRGMCMDLELMDWLNNYTFKEEEKYEDLKYAKKAYEIFVNDLKFSATTRASIFATRHRKATQLLMDLMDKTGLISYVGKVNMDREAPIGLVEESALSSALETFKWINDTINKYENTYPILTPRFIPSCTDLLMEELREIQMTYKIPVQSHLSESLGEIDFVKHLRPNNKFYAEAYNEYDLFGKNKSENENYKTIMAHCIYSSEEEIELLRKNEVFIAHCPQSNMNLSSGIAPIRKYLNLGLNIGLATDIAAGHSMSMFRAVTDCIQVSKLYFKLIDSKYNPIKFTEAFYLATKGGGKFFGNVGSFEVGYEFDALIIDDLKVLHPYELSILERLERAFYLSLDEKYLKAKIVKGKFIFK